MPPPPKPKAPGPAVNPEEEAKKETAVMGRPAEAPKPKKDTSRVQVTAAKPATPEAPRPTVKLRREIRALLRQHLRPRGARGVHHAGPETTADHQGHPRTKTCRRNGQRAERTRYYAVAGGACAVARCGGLFGLYHVRLSRPNQIGRFLI